MIEEWIDILDPEETFEIENNKFNIMAYINARNSYLYYRKALIDTYSDPEKDKYDEVYASKMRFNIMDDMPDGEFLLWTEDTGLVRTDKAKCLAAYLHVNRTLNIRGYISLEEFYIYLGVEHVNIDPTAKHKGWTTDMMDAAWVQFLDIYLIKHDRIGHEPVYSFMFDVDMEWFG